MFKEVDSFESVQELKDYANNLDKHNKEIKKEIDKIESEVLKLVLQQNIKEGKFEMLGHTFQIKTQSKFKIVNEQTAYPVLKRAAPGLVKETVNYQSLQKTMRELDREIPGVSVIQETKIKL